MRIILFRNINEYRVFFERLGHKTEDNIEYNMFGGYSRNRMLITAEHAFTERIAATEYGRHAYIGIGDKNTDILAKMAAFHVQGAYIIPWISRYKVDFARNPRLIGRNNKLLVSISRSEVPRKKHITVHNDMSYQPLLIKYLDMIKRMKPSFILSYHGMHRRHSSDISIGAGSNCAYLGGSEQAKRFVSFVRERINTKSREFGFKKPLTIRLSTLFLGTRNYMLNSFTRNCIGCQVEFNLRGRICEKRRMPILKFQAAAQLIAECMRDFRWK